MQRPVAPTQRDHSELMAAKINRAQQIERRAQAARRRLTLLTVQFAVGIVLVAAAAVTSFSWLWSLTPLATMGVTLFLGARAAQAGRENDQRALERIRALETRPAKGHRVSESEKKYAQLSAKAEDFGSQAKAETTAESESVKTSEQLEKTETITADTEAAATDQQTSGGLGQSALGKLAAAARRAANFREYFVRGEAEIAAKAHEETAETTSEVEVASQHQAEAPTETAAPAVAVSKETDAFESKPTEIAEVVAEVKPKLPRKSRLIKQMQNRYTALRPAKLKVPRLNTVSTAGLPRPCRNRFTPSNRGWLAGT